MSRCGGGGGGGGGGGLVFLYPVFGFVGLHI